MLIAAVVAVPLVLALGHWGMTALYAVAGVVAVVLLIRALRSDLAPAVAAVRRWRPSAIPLAPSRTGRSALPRTAGSAPARATRSVPAPAPGARSIGSSRGWFVAVVVFVGAAAWLMAQLGTKGLVGAGGAAALVVLLFFARDKTTVLTFVAACSLAGLLHKSFGPKNLQVSGGAISAYVTSFDALVVLLFALWAWEGTLVADLRAAARRPLLWLPPAALLFLLPSLLVAQDLTLATAELVRMGWMFLAYVYFAVRVRTRRQIVAALAGLGVIAAIQFVVVVLQWRTGGALGLSFLGVPTSLGERTTDSATINRPFGTMIHPVFMAAALGIIAMVALAYALELRRSLAKITAIGVTLACLACMWISQTRASFVAAGAAGAVLGVVALVRGRLRRRTVGQLALLGLIGVAAFWPKISEKLSANFATGHYREEVASRVELNDLALAMMADHPILGVGLNNFEVVLPRYETHPVIFYNNPVHNLYLLYLSEVGVVGMIGVAAVGGVLLLAAIRLGRSPDAVLSALGLGVAGAMGFLMIEELLGFSLRQDIPLGLYWLLAGLVVAGLEQAAIPLLPVFLRPVSQRPVSLQPHHGQPHHGQRRQGARPRPAAPRRADAGRHHLVRRVGVSTLVAALLPLAAFLPAGSALAPAAVAVTEPSVGLVFSALDRSTLLHVIYSANADGTNQQKISPSDGRGYDWSRFAFGNTKIVYTVHSGRVGNPEDIGLMNPDGSNPVVLRHFNYRVVQPVIDRDGRYVYYTGRTPFFPLVAQYRMDLRTGISVNMSAVTSPNGSFDADPWITTGSYPLVFVNNTPGAGTAIEQVHADGTGRQALTTRKYFNTDPAVSTDGGSVAISSYRGPADLIHGNKDLNFQSAYPNNWNVVVQQRRRGGVEQVLTKGKECIFRSEADSCAPDDLSGFVPRFFDGDRSVSFTGALNSKRTCICAVDVDGRNPRIIVSSTDLAIDWHDWPQQPGASTTLPRLADWDRSTVLATVLGPKGVRQLVTASRDFAVRTPIVLPKGLQPVDAHWGPKGSLVFTANTSVGSPRTPHPAPPSGSTRRAHVTLADLDPVAVNRRAAARVGTTAQISSQQVFLRTADGKVRQLTDPWIEDWRDGVAPDDARGNSQPRISADGRYVTFTNTSIRTNESFLLRLDLSGGDVMNLTNGTAGALPTDDGDLAVSPDGSTVSFAWTEGGLRGIYRMDAATGFGVRSITRDTTTATAPNYAPDGSFLVYVRLKGTNWQVVRARPDGSGSQVLGQSLKSAVFPMVSPDAQTVYAVARYASALDFYAMRSDGSSTAVPVQPDLLYSVLSADWK